MLPHEWQIRRLLGGSGGLKITSQTRAPRQVAIGERRQPNPKGKPGYLRVDTVHQGQRDGQPGVYHINAVDTRFQAHFWIGKCYG